MITPFDSSTSQMANVAYYHYHTPQVVSSKVVSTRQSGHRSVSQFDLYQILLIRIQYVDVHIHRDFRLWYFFRKQLLNIPLKPFVRQFLVKKRDIHVMWRFIFEY